MLEQQGRVIAAAAGRISVRLGGRSGCAACDAGRGCGAGVFGRLLRRRPLELEFENHLDAHVGEAVVVGVPEAWFLRLTARFYLIPLLAGLAGAALGTYLSLVMQADAALRDLVALATAVAAGALAAAVGRRRARPMEFSGAEAVHLLRRAQDAPAGEALT